MGSGSTVAAAEAVGLSAIGIERLPEYYAMACQAIPSLAGRTVARTALQVLEQMFNGINIAGSGCTTSTGAITPCAPVGTLNSAGVLQTAGMHLRASSSFQSNLANGNYFGLAGTLNTLNYNKGFAGNANPSCSAISSAGMPPDSSHEPSSRGTA